MPTPSSNPPDPPRPSHTSGFLSCPDDAIVYETAEETVVETVVEMQRDSIDEGSERAASPSPSPAPPSEMASTVGQTTAADGDADDSVDSAASSRSTTRSPAPDIVVADEADNNKTVVLPRQHAEHMDDDGSSTARISGSWSDNAESVVDLIRYQPRKQPVSPRLDRWLDPDREVLEEDILAPSMGFDFPSLRVLATFPSSYLRPGSRFVGTQKSDKATYEVEVDIKHVDLRESFLCGYLRIEGLTEDHPNLTTYFEGEIIGPRHGFQTKTRHEEWGATPKTDVEHWEQFEPFATVAAQAGKHAKPHRKLQYAEQQLRYREQDDYIFMRWKEHFLVPNHRVKTILGASFEGFYYICFSRREGDVYGIYFHQKSEKHQKLTLSHVPDMGCWNAMEFR